MLVVDVGGEFHVAIQDITTGEKASTSKLFGTWSLVKQNTAFLEKEVDFFRVRVPFRHLIEKTSHVGTVPAIKLRLQLKTLYAVE